MLLYKKGEKYSKGVQLKLMCYKRNTGKCFYCLIMSRNPPAPCVALLRTKVEKTMKGTGSLYAAPFLRKALWVLR